MAMNLSSGGGASRGGRRRPRRRAMSEINVTPLVDVMLVLLIIFMVAAPLLASGVPIELPESRAEPLQKEDEPIEIALDRNGGLFIDGKAVTMGALPDRLALIAESQNPEKPQQILLRGDKAIDYGRMMAVMGELNRAGLNSISLVTTGSSDGQ